MALSKAQSQDIENNVEAAVIAALGADAWLKEGGTGGIAEIHAKYLPADVETIWDATTPLLLVCAESHRRMPGGGTFGTYGVVVECSITWIETGADLADLKDAAQTMKARLMRFLWDERHDGSRLNGLLDTGEGRIVSEQALTDEEENEDETGDPFRTGAEVDFEVELRVTS